ncbi:MAG: pyridoxamine 5'-phosphate oxidase family protein [Atopobiaceae bacterium]|jgi:nitroimidazol reductase NimA-like FMN-containing flavoprotein (pyridoxamine 5'-phosphate oxidase superfamily)|nr:pyridoxamine 5'-phosphate oxidase family protein [Atopobiaceae bacterium]NLH90976.1 hypothetical protein [Atopobium sp.]
MIRKDRQIKDVMALKGLLDACNVMHIGLSSDNGDPYVVPVSFGYKWDAALPSLYFHGASVGQKSSLLVNGARVCVEFDRFIRYDELQHGITARYQSLVGYGSVDVLTSYTDKAAALSYICLHCGYKKFNPTSCESLSDVMVWRINLDHLDGKQNLRSLS